MVLLSFKGYKRSIVLEFNYQEITKGVPQIKQQMALLNAEYRKAQAEVDKTGTSFDKLGVKQEYLKNKQQLQAKQVEELRKKVEALKVTEDANSKTLNNAVIALKNAETQLSKTEKELEEVNKEVETQKTTIGQLSTQWGDFKNKLNDAGVNVDQIAGNLQKVGAAMVAVGTASAGMNMSFNTAMTKARTISDETQMSFEDMKSGVLELSKEYGIAANDMASAFYDVLTSNVQTKDSMKALNEAARLSKAGFTDIGTSIDILTTLMNGYGLSVDEASLQVDQLIKTQKLGKLNVGEFAESIGDIIGLGAQAGAEITELEASIAALTLSGLSADKSITGIKGVLTSIISPTAEAQAKAKELGLQFNAAALESKGFAKFLDDVRRKTRGNTEDMAALFGNVRALNAAMVLTGEGADNFTRCLEDIENSAGTADDVLNLLQEDTGNKLNKALQNLKNSLVEAGGAFTPVIEMITGFLNILAKLPSGVIVGITAIGGLLAIVGSLVKTFNFATSSLSSLSKIGKIFSAGAGNTVYLTFLKWSGVIIAVATAIALVIWGINTLIGKTAQLQQGFTETTNAMNGIKDKVNNNINSTSRAHYAIGTQYHRGGVAYVGEYGPEEVWLPEGSRVVTARDTKKNLHRQENDTGNLEMLLKEVINKMDKIEANIKEQPRKQQQLLRMGTV